MKRTKLWWAGLTKKERSELHHLDLGNSKWLSKYTGGPKLSLIQECRRNELIKKANKAIYFAEVVKTNCAN